MGVKDVVIVGLAAVVVWMLTLKALPKQIAFPLPTTQTVTAPTMPAINNKDDCDAAGGKWERRGDSGTLICTPATSDAGKPCNDRSDCESFCWAGEGPQAFKKISGTCYPWKYFSKCINSINNGRTTSICVGGVNMIKVEMPD